jgi:hypothetical protein
MSKLAANAGDRPGPQPPGVASGEPGGRQADPQSSRRRLHAPAVRLPQQCRLRIERHTRAVGECLQRPMLEPARLLDPAAGSEAIG